MFGTNLKNYREKAGFTLENLADRINDITNNKFNKSTIRTWENGSNPKIEIISIIADILNIPEQFLFDDSKKAINKIVSQEIPNIKQLQEHTKKVSFIDGYVGAGSGGCINCETVSSFLYVDNSIIKKGYEDKEIKALTVIGDSMCPYVDNNDIVLFSHLQKGQYNCCDGKYIITTINGTMVKNLSFRTNGDIVISSCNKCYSDEIIKSNESQEILDIIGIVVGRILKN